MEAEINDLLAAHKALVKVLAYHEQYTVDTVGQLAAALQTVSRIYSECRDELELDAQTEADLGGCQCGGGCEVQKMRARFFSRDELRVIGNVTPGIPQLAP